MNNKGFTLVELLGSLVMLGLILGIGLYSARGTLSTTMTTLNNVSMNELYDTAEIYVIENNNTWFNNLEEYTCVMVDELVDKGYFDEDDVSSYKGKFIRIVRDNVTKTISSRKLVDVCE